MTSTLRFNLGDVRLRDEERRELQKLSRKLIELKANHYRVTESRLPRAFSRCARLTGEGRVKSLRRFDRTGAGSASHKSVFFCFFPRVRLGRSVCWRRPKGAQLSLREVSKELAAHGFFNELGKPYAAKSVASMLR